MSYQRKLIRQAQRAARDAKQGSVAVVTVYHDHNCAHWRGGPCNCEPFIGPRRPVEQVGGRVMGSYRQGRG